MAELDSIARALGSVPEGQPRPVGGGCIHRSYRWGNWFIKTNSADQAANFEAEAAGLEAIAGTATIRVPEVLGRGGAGDTAWLALEALDLVPDGDDERLGEQLAALHATPADRYGFAHDNFIGSTPQANRPGDSWPGFFRDLRLGPMISRLEARGVGFRQADALLSKLPDLLPEAPAAALIHGDLWGGNKAFLADGTPVLFDPAAHHADPECDLAMTGLFGGFSGRFHEAYRHHRPAPDGLETLHEIYRLYHVLNHALLFGGGYVSQARGIMARLV